MDQIKPANIENIIKRDYPREFFEVQVNLAEKVAKVLDIPLSEALLNYTGLYRRFNLTREREVDGNNALWQEFIASLGNGNVVEQTYKYYLKRKDIEPEQALNKKNFGCFTSEYLPDQGCVRTHFGNREKNGSPFDDKNLGKRLQELKEMFEYVKKNYPDAKVVRGSSWLYNLLKYRRFFPPEYTRDLKPTTPHFNGLSIWGQFLDQNMKVKPEVMNLFQTKLAQAQSFEEVVESIPLKTFKVETNIENFYNFYGIK